MDNTQDIKVDAPAFRTLLQRVCLGGLVEECVLNVEKGVAHIRAVDMTNSVFLSVTSKVGPFPDGDYGLGSLSTIIRFLDGEAEYSITLKNDKITLLRKNHGKITLALLKPSEVPTAVAHTDSEKKLLAVSTIQLNFTQEHAERFGFYMGVVASQSVSLQGADGKVTLKSGEFEQNKFSIPVGKYEGKDFTVSLYGSFLLKVLNALPWTEETKPLLLVGDKSPLLIRLGNKNLWALTPVSASQGAGE